MQQSQSVRVCVCVCASQPGAEHCRRLKHLCSDMFNWSQSRLEMTSEKNVTWQDQTESVWEWVSFWLFWLSVSFWFTALKKVEKLSVWVYQYRTKEKFNIWSSKLFFYLFCIESPVNTQHNQKHVEAWTIHPHLIGEHFMKQTQVC